MTSHLDTKKIEHICKTLKKPVVLTGMMGAGKSHIGKMLADVLTLPFYDSDKVIEENGGLSINEIFELYGEEKFRESESRTIADLLKKGPCIIATGGGALTTPEVLKNVKVQSHSVWLNASVEKIMQRLEKTKNRPLLKVEDPQAVLEGLYKKRTPLYEQMDITVDTGAGDAEMTLQKIIDSIDETL